MEGVEALIFSNGVWVCSSGLAPELLKELRKLAEDPGCSDKRYRLTSVILNTQEIPQEPAEVQVDPADEQQGDQGDQPSAAEDQSETDAEEGTSKKRKAADIS